MIMTNQDGIDEYISTEVYISNGRPTIPCAPNHTMTRFNWEIVRAFVDGFYKNHTDDEIAEYNHKLSAEMDELMYGNRPSREKVKKTGFIYLIREASEGHYKIGRTVDVKSRMKTFTVKLPFKIELIHYFPADDYILAEKVMHELYDHARVDGEWFRLRRSERADIKNILSFKDGKRHTDRERGGVK